MFFYSSDGQTIERQKPTLTPCQLLSLAALNMENLEGDYYVPGTELDSGDGIWKEMQARGRVKETKMLFKIIQ